MGVNLIPREATAETVSSNVRFIRRRRKLTLRGLSEKVTLDTNRPLTHGVIDGIERGTRRVDVDDLMALAVALDVSPSDLLTPSRVTPFEIVEATGLGRVRVDVLRRWIGTKHSDYEFPKP